VNVVNVPSGSDSHLCARADIKPMIGVEREQCFRAWRRSGSVYISPLSAEFC